MKEFVFKILARESSQQYKCHCEISAKAITASKKRNQESYIWLQNRTAPFESAKYIINCHCFAACCVQREEQSTIKYTRVALTFDESIKIIHGFAFFITTRSTFACALERYEFYSPAEQIFVLSSLPAENIKEKKECTSWVTS